MAFSKVMTVRGAAIALAAVSMIELGVILYLIRDELSGWSPKPEISLLDTYGMTVDQVIRQFGKPDSIGFSKYADGKLDPRYKKDDPDRWNIAIRNNYEVTLHQALYYGDFALYFNLHHRMAKIEKIPLKSPEKKPADQDVPPS